LHQATGILIWVTAFTMTYLARIASGRTVVAAQRTSGVGADVVVTGHAGARMPVPAR
jgi:hypothetical protein